MKNYVLMHRTTGLFLNVDNTPGGVPPYRTLQDATVFAVGITEPTAEFLHALESTCTKLEVEIIKEISELFNVASTHFVIQGHPENEYRIRATMMATTKVFSEASVYTIDDLAECTYKKTLIPVKVTKTIRIV